MRKRKGEKKIIGLMVEEIISDFSKEYIQSVINAVRPDDDIRLIVLAGKYYEDTDAFDDIRYYKTVYNTIFRLGEQCHIDGLIIHLGSMSAEKMARVKSRYSQHFYDIPKIFVGLKTDKYTTVNYDHASGIIEAMDYLIKGDGLTKFCMLGGREDNVDARDRKEIFVNCLRSNGLVYTEDQFENTDMSTGCVEEATALLDRNPGVQAVFCVNDASAKGLYDAMKLKDLTPGKDILVFGFDNTRMSGSLSPTLSSIGSSDCTLGHKALELLLKKLNDEEVESAFVPTRLYGRESLQYEMYDYSFVDMTNADQSFINRMFDDCFYRYKSELNDDRAVDLKRLFNIFMSKIFLAIKKRYISFEEYNEIERMINKFFEKGIMEYTDAIKLINSLERLQNSLNSIQRSPSARIIVNHLFSVMRNNAICSIAEQKNIEKTAFTQTRNNLQEFLICGMQGEGTPEQNSEKLLRMLGLLGLQNAVLYLYDEPAKFDHTHTMMFPEELKMKCVIKAGKLYLLPKERQSCILSDLFIRDELPLKCKGFATFIIFYGDYIYGFLMCELAGDIYDRGEHIAIQLGKSFYINDMQSKNIIDNDKE